MIMATCENVYTSCSCNCTPSSVDWGCNDIIAYASCRAVIIAQSKAPTRVIDTITGHGDRVNSVHWIRSWKHENETELVSTSTDKTCIVWRNDGDKFKLVSRLSGHTSTVTLAKGIYCEHEDDNTRTLIASASVDSSVKIWERKSKNDEFTCMQSILFGTGFAMALGWVHLPKIQKPLLACGGDDNKIYLFFEENNQFHIGLKLIGHEDWIRDLNFAVDDDGDVLLASSSQDNYIRLWRIAEYYESRLPDKSLPDLESERDIQLKENTFSVPYKDSRQTYAVRVESVLQGHENKVYSIKWKPPCKLDSRWHQPMCILSASMDKTMTLWTLDPDNQIWVEEVCVGTVGGNTLGLYGAVFSGDGDSILAHGFHGAFHMWHRKDSSPWEPGVTVGGHFDSVEDLDWDPEEGMFVISVSNDQTSRLHAYWQSDVQSERTWHEIARPQVHGYDITCLSMINRYLFASGADEKVIRIFEAPKNFIENLSTLCKIELSPDIAKLAPDGAKVPALGLSNKAVFGDESLNNDEQETGDMKVSANEQYKQAYFTPLSLSAPPTEEDLLQNTLWPEIQKLYGHGYEIFSIAAHPNGKLIATACKAAKSEHAAILLWETSSWHQVGQLMSHSLTVTDITFSHSGQFILSVSRDRTWSLFKQKDSNELGYERVAFTDKKTSVHSRIIWATSWSHDDKYFITVSRDKKAVIWTDQGGAGDSSLGGFVSFNSTLSLGESITAVHFAPRLVNGGYVVAFGLDNGTIQIYSWTDTEPQTKDSWTELVSLCQRDAHHLTVKKIRFQPLSMKERRTYLTFASCSSDHSLKIYTLKIT